MKVPEIKWTKRPELGRFYWISDLVWINKPDEGDQSTTKVLAEQGRFLISLLHDTFRLFDGSDLYNNYSSIEAAKNAARFILMLENNE